MLPDAAKVLVLFPGALGDFVCFLPALEKMARTREVDLLARSEYAGIVSERIRVGSLERHEISRLFSADAGEDETLRKFFSAYRCIYSWLGSREQTFIRSLRAVFKGELRCFSFHPQRSVHAVDYYLSCVGGVFSPQDWHGILRPRATAVAWARQYASQHGLGQKPILVLAPGSGAKEKNWPPAAYKEVARAWKGEFEGVTIIVLGPAEEEDPEIRRTFSSEAHVLRRLNIGQIAALLSQSHAHVGNDSGLTHLAAAMGVPTVAVFGPTDPARWAPRGDKVSLVSQQVDCSPCEYRTMKSCAHRRCLTGLPATDVVLKLSKHFGSPQQADAP